MLLGLALVASVLQASGAAQTLLRWKFERGTPLRYAFPQETKSRARVKGQELITSNATRTEVRVTPEGELASGALPVSVVLERIQMALTAPQVGTVTYDSAAGRASEYLQQEARFYNAFTRRPFMAGITPRGEFRSVELPDEHRAKLAEQWPVDRIASPEGLRQLTGIQWPIFPEQPVEPGQSWEQVDEVPNLAGGRVQARRTYTYEGSEERGGRRQEKINLVAVLTLMPDETEQALQLAIKEQNVRGTYYFDNDAGHFTEGQTFIKLVLDTRTDSDRFDQTVETKSGLVLLPPARVK